jgi:carboxyl-terminal processing protease
MSLTVRGILVVIIGTVLGLTVSIGGEYLSRAEAQRRAAAVNPDPAAVLADVIARVQEEYVDRIDSQVLIESAIRGIVEELDGHSRYLDTLDYEDIRISASGRYAGVGLDVALREGAPTVITPIADAPAQRAGIMAGDVVVAVDGAPVTAENFHRMVGRMRGPAGTNVLVAVNRAGQDGPLDFLLERADIEVATVTGEHLGEGFAYVRLSGFAENTAPGLDQIAARIQAEAGRALRGIVLDLRNNPGGVLESAVAVADRFLESGLIVRGSGRIAHARFEHRAHSGDALEDTPLVVLVNGGSASASEIVAGALRDHNRAKIIGLETFGKGSVQTVMPLAAGRALKITTSRYVLPSGRSLNGNGIRPDVWVRNDDPQRLFRGTSAGVPLSEDRQLLRALRTIGYTPVTLSQAL